MNAIFFYKTKLKDWLAVRSAKPAVLADGSVHRFMSQKFRFYTFVCIALLLFVHGYNLKVTYLSPFSLVDEPLTFTTFFEYFMANGLLRFRIPLLFLISGYIFSVQDKRPYGKRVQRRFFSLMMPYFIWSALGLAMTYLWQQHPVTLEAVQAAALDQLGDNRTYEEIGWGGVLLRWLVAPVSFQLWFIRSLFVYNLLYPVLRWGVVRFPGPAFLLLSFLWISFFQVPLIEGQGLFFFTLGIYLHKHSFPLEKRPEWYSPFLNWVVFLGICFIKTFMAFEFDALTPTLRWAMMILYAMATFSGMLAVWFSLDRLVRWCMQKPWFVWATDFSFFVYGLHIPLLAYVTNIFFMYFGSWPLYRLFTYLAAPTAVLLFCLGAGAFTRRLMPGVYKAMTGGRGF